MRSVKYNAVFRRHVIFICCCFLLASCSGTKNLPEGQVLYTGSSVKILGEGNIKTKAINSEASEAFAPRRNKKFLGMRPKLAIYNSVKNTKGKKFKMWLKYKVGEAPVLIKDVKPAEVAKVIDAKLFNMGIFNGSTSYEIKTKKRTAAVVYILHVHEQFRISSFRFDSVPDELHHDIKKSLDKTFIRTDQFYDLAVLKAERSRIDSYLKDMGYFYFNPDYLLFKADSSINDKTVRLQLSVKEDIPARSYMKYRYRNIYFESDFSLSDLDTMDRDTTFSRGIYFVEDEMVIRHRVISRVIFTRSQDIYSQKKHNMTLSRLMSMGNFKFVNIRFTEADTSAPGYLDASIYATPSPKRTIRFELDLVSKSNNFIGPAQTINYKNRNSMNGAELLNLNLRGSFETQFAGRYRGLYSFEIGPQLELFLPKFLVPFRIRTPKSFYIPKTRFSLSYNYLQRVQYYNLISLQFIFGYKWKENIKTEHELNPVNINYISISKKTPEFQQLLDDNFLLKRSFEEQFIAGMNYSYTYNEQVFPEKKLQYFINGTADFAGNTITLGKKLLLNETPTESQPLLLNGKPYAQFARATLDLRNYLRLSKNSKLVYRLYGGAGIAYGNSNILPYVKQFFSGGPNSIRAFRINTLGPGSYQKPDSIASFIEQGGDIKLEVNVEYRFPIISVIKGAFFVDAGNIWLRNENKDIQVEGIGPRFYREIGVGTGFGIRLDVTFFVLRLDLAFPLRKPWLPENDRWVMQDIRFGNSDWRRDNLVLNIAIGYPF